MSTPTRPRQSGLPPARSWIARRCSTMTIGRRSRSSRRKDLSLKAWNQPELRRREPYEDRHATDALASRREVLAPPRGADRLAHARARAAGVPRRRRAGGARRRARLPRRLGGRAPRPARVLALLGARGPARVRRRAHDERSSSGTASRSRRTATTIRSGSPSASRRSTSSPRAACAGARARAPRAPSRAASRSTPRSSTTSGARRSR